MKLCVQCGAPLIKRAHESKKRFSKKQFCSSVCSREYMKINQMGWYAKDSERDIFISKDTSWL